VLTARRLLGRQRPYYQDIVDGNPPQVSVLIPMHNEEAVAHNVMDALIHSDYPQSHLEVVPIDDHSKDGTRKILDRYSAAHPHIKPLFRDSPLRGKPAALNDGMAVASHETILVFDADNQPPAGMVRELGAAFIDPEVGAVMGRVVPKNAGAGLITRLLDLERSGGYQVDQQARYSMDLVPQYGGTVGGFRRSVAQSWGGFDPKFLAEDTDMTYRLYLKGWRVAYANRAECYEEVPESWDVRFRQLRRWARGHTQAMFRHVGPLLRSRFMSFGQKLDGLLVLFIYLVPPMLMSGLIANLALFLMGRISIGTTLLLGLFTVGYNAFGNFAPFYEVGMAALLDNVNERVLLLPLSFFLFLYNTMAVTAGFFDGVIDLFRSGMPNWDKTRRFAK
jgi:cellulose synthase/poly-beta-1,6-N-acetylglucosamine synthase-like glycosyltransferase